MEADLRNFTLVSMVGPNTQGSIRYKLRRRAVSDDLRQLLRQCNVPEDASIGKEKSTAAMKVSGIGTAEAMTPPSKPKLALPTTLEEVEALSTALATKLTNLQARERDLEAVTETEAASWPVCPSCTFVNESSQVPQCAICGCKNESLWCHDNNTTQFRTTAEEYNASASAKSSAQKSNSIPRFTDVVSSPFGKDDRSGTDAGGGDKCGRGMGSGGGPFGSGSGPGFSNGAPPPFDDFPPFGGPLPPPPLGEAAYVGGHPPPRSRHTGFGLSPLQHSFGMPVSPHGSHEAKASAGHWTCMSCGYMHSDANPLESCMRCQSPNPSAPSYEWTLGLKQAAAQAQVQKAQKSAAAVAGAYHGSGGGYGVPWGGSSSGNVFNDPVGGENFHSVGVSSGSGSQKTLKDRAAAIVASQGPYLPPKVATSSLRDDVHRLLKQLTNDGIGADCAAPSIEASSEGRKGLQVLVLGQARHFFQEVISICRAKCS